MTLKIIGAGFGRTGTKSLKLGLEQLGLGPCYHMTEVAEDPRRAGDWIDALAGEPVDWDAVFDGYQSTVDWPACRFWRELSDAYPDAMVLLSQREGRGWHKSVMNTIYNAMSADVAGVDERSILPMVRKLVFEDTFQGRLSDPEYAIEVFDRHNQAVRDSVAPDRLFVYEPGDGWEPLCEFFGVEVPDANFPNVNSTEEFRAQFLGRTGGEGG